MLATELRDLRIGYVPYESTLTRPGDRRRFVYYARKRGIPFEFASLDRDYDVVVVTPGGDISQWSRYQGRAKVIYEQIDSYLAIPRTDVKAALRGLAKFATGQNRRLLLDYNEGIRQMCRRADAVICSTLEQQQQISSLCPNVHLILDFHTVVSHRVKGDYECGETFHFVWEGLPGNLEFFRGIRDVLRRMAGKRKIALHAVTDLEYGQYLGGRYGRRRTLDLARRIVDCPVHLYAWNEQTCAAIVTACDLALIPVPLDDPVNAGKPENKLLLFWRMGMPCVVSATPAYARAMQEAGLGMAASSKQEWLTILERYMEDAGARREAGTNGRIFAEKQHGELALLERWDRLFTSVVQRRAAAYEVGP